MNDVAGDASRADGARRELRKTNELISRPIVRGQFTLLGRKVFNCMILHAQRARVPGLNAPGPSEAYKKLFWAPLSDVARDARYDSNDTEALKEVARQLMEIQVETETETEWTSDHLVEKVMIVNPAGLGKRGGRLWLGFRFPEEVMHLVTDPSRYTRLPIHYLTQLRSGPAVALYECGKESSWKTSGLTAKMPWEEWQTTLEGKPRADLQGWKTEYKFFKDRVLKKAILEVNTLTDIEVELIEYKAGRRVTDIQFRVRKKLQPPLEFPPHPVIDTSILDCIVAFGISRREAEDILATHDDAFLKATCAYVRKRADDKSQPAIKSITAYFRTALRDRYAETAKPVALIPQLPPPQPPPETSASNEAILQAKQDALRRVEAMNETEIEELFEQFYQANPDKPFLRVLTKRKSAKVARTMLVAWMVEAGR